MKIIERIILRFRGLRTLIGKEVYITWIRDKSDWNKWRILAIDGKWILLQGLDCDGSVITECGNIWKPLEDIDLIENKGIGGIAKDYYENKIA
jgi:hypothetical protein